MLIYLMNCQIMIHDSVNTIKNHNLINTLSHIVSEVNKDLFNKSGHYLKKVILVDHNEYGMFSAYKEYIYINLNYSFILNECDQEFIKAALLHEFGHTLSYYSKKDMLHKKEVLFIFLCSFLFAYGLIYRLTWIISLFFLFNLVIFVLFRRIKLIEEIYCDNIYYYLYNKQISNPPLNKFQIYSLIHPWKNNRYLPLYNFQELYFNEYKKKLLDNISIINYFHLMIINPYELLRSYIISSYYKIKYK